MSQHDIELNIRQLADRYAHNLQRHITKRIEEMAQDDTSHYLLYNVLGISNEEGKYIDQYQNTGRFLYKYAGSFLEEAAFACFQYAYPEAQKIRVPNTLGARPKTFEIDCLVQELAHEIKWRDATTDGDHITKEHTRIQAIKAQGYTPVRIMFYYPQREQAKKIQGTLRTLYQGIGGMYYAGDEAWSYVRQKTGVDLLQILTTIAKERG